MRPARIIKAMDARFDRRQTPSMRGFTGRRDWPHRAAIG
jgi:hypothetical protein